MRFLSPVRLLARSTEVGAVRLRPQAGTRPTFGLRRNICISEFARRGKVGFSRTAPTSVERTAAAFCLLLTTSAHAAIVCDGVLGNSGEQGAALVKSNAAAGIGVVYDRFGTLWSRGGDGYLNRYALDGRLLAQVSIPKNNNSNDNDTLALCGDTLVLKIKTALHTLPITAPGAATGKAAPLNLVATRLSFGSSNGWVAAANKNEVFLVNAQSGEKKALATAVRDVNWLEMAPDGAVYAVCDWKTYKFTAGATEQPSGWPKGAPGERPQLLDNYWFGHAWHGTIRRFDSDLNPAPGVVLGGASGSFIGHLEENPEVSNGRGLAKLRGESYAVSGIDGVLHILAWQGDKQKFEIVRRLGSVPQAPTLGLDRKGRVWWFGGSWNWNDAPDAPLGNGVGVEAQTQAVTLENGLVAAGTKWGKTAILRGTLDKELAIDRIENGAALPKNPRAAAVYKSGNQTLLLLANAAAQAVAFRINAEGRYEADAGAVTLQTAAPLRDLTSLAMKDPNTLLAAADGFIIELTRDGANWKEARRWNRWGEAPDAMLGTRIFICADGNKLWVAEHDHHRVLVFDLASGKLLDSFGKLDQPGDDLASLASPETIAACEGRAVVFDKGNQRLMKLRLTE